MGTYAQRARRVAGRARRKIGGSAAAEKRLADARAELKKTKRKLDATEKELAQARTELDDARRRLGEGPPPLPDAVEQAIARVREEHLTYLKDQHLRDLASITVDIESRDLPGLLIEAGTARGGSAIVIATAKAKDRPMKVYDVFGTIPPPTERDGADVHERYEKIAAGDAKGPGGETYYGYRDDLYGEVVDSFTRLGIAPDENRVELIKGLFEDTIDLDEPVALAHLDGDWYESTMTCLTRIAPLLVPGGRIVLDDYYKWSGCRAAVDEYFAEREGFRFERHARLHVVRV